MTTTQEAGTRGGLKTLKKHGKKHFKKIAKEMWKAKKTMNDKKMSVDDTKTDETTTPETKPEEKAA